MAWATFAVLFGVVIGLVNKMNTCTDPCHSSLFCWPTTNLTSPSSSSMCVGDATRCLQKRMPETNVSNDSSNEGVSCRRGSINATRFRGKRARESTGASWPATKLTCTATSRHRKKFASCSACSYSYSRGLSASTSTGRPSSALPNYAVRGTEKYPVASFCVAALLGPLAS